MYKAYKYHIYITYSAYQLAWVALINKYIIAQLAEAVSMEEVSYIIIKV